MQHSKITPLVNPVVKKEASKAKDLAEKQRLQKQAIVLLETPPRRTAAAVIMVRGGTDAIIEDQSPGDSNESTPARD